MYKDQNAREIYKYHTVESDIMDKIQKRKGHVKVVTALIIASTLLFGVVLIPPDWIIVDGKDENIDVMSSFVYTSILFLLWMVTFIIANFLHRVCLLVEEWFHTKTRYGGSYKKLLIAVFCGAWNKIHFIVCVLIIAITCLHRDYAIVLNACRSNILMLIMTLVLLLLWFCLKGWSDTEFEHSASCAPCIGIAMAYGVYYSYYKEVLEKMKERIEEAEKYFGIDICLKRLILLFPSSGNIQGQLGDGYSDVTYFKELPAIEKDKGGTLDRKMTNTIYNVSPRNESPFYCIVEGINCLSTLKNMKLPEDVFKQQAHLLYKTLQEILDDSPYRNSYVLLYYEDDVNENKTPLSSVLCKRHKELLDNMSQR